MPGLPSHSKTHGHDLHHLNPLLSLIAAELSWDRLEQLLATKHFAMGQTVWSLGYVPTDIYFIIDGEFALRKLSNVTSTQSHQLNISPSSTSKATTFKLCNRGTTLGAYEAWRHEPLEYEVISMKYKSVAVSLSRSKFKTILNQLPPEREASALHLLDAIRNDTHDSIKRFEVDPDYLLNPLSQPTECTRARPHVLAHPLTRPVEYECPSGVLILHETIPDPHHASNPRLNPVCEKIKSNMARRLERLNVPEKYNLGPTVRKARHVAQTQSTSLLKEKPVSRLLKPLAHDKHWFRDADGHTIVHAGRLHSCELRTNVGGLLSGSSSTPILQYSQAHGRKQRPQLKTQDELSPMTKGLYVPQDIPTEDQHRVHRLSLSDILEKSHCPCSVPVLP